MQLPLVKNETPFLLIAILYSGCAFFDDGHIEQTCEDFAECFPSTETVEPDIPSDTSTDTGPQDTEDSSGDSSQYYIPDRFYAATNVGILNQQASLSSNWENQLLIILTKDDGNLYPHINDSCVVSLTTSTGFWPLDNTIQHTWYGTHPGFNNVTYTPLCNDIEPAFLESTLADIRNAQWKIGFGELTNATRTEFTTYMQSMLGGENQAMYSYAATLYLQTTWGGSDLVISPGAILSHPLEQQTINEDEYIVLQNVTAPPDGYYFSYPMFHYAIPSE